MPSTIAISGSMKFFNEMKALQAELAGLGINALIPENEGAGIDYSAMSRDEIAEVKSRFMDEHIRKIKASDAVLVANYPKNGIENYIGANSFLEMGFAYLLGKRIFLLFSIPDQPNTAEILGMRPVELRGDLKAIRKFL